MAMPSFIDKAQKAIFKKLSGDMSGIFIWTTIVGYLSASSAQLYGISQNKKLSKDKKKFQTFQELSDCAINIMAYFTLTKGMTKFSRNLASSGKILSNAIANQAKVCGIDLSKKVNIGKEISKKITELTHTKDVLTKRNIAVTSDAMNKISTDIENLNKLNDKYTPFVNGMGMIGTITGGLISSDIITPVLRNKYAAIKQKDTKYDVQPIEKIATKPITYGNYTQTNAPYNASSMKI